MISYDNSYLNPSFLISCSYEIVVEKEFYSAFFGRHLCVWLMDNLKNKSLSSVCESLCSNEKKPSSCISEYVKGVVSDKVQRVIVFLIFRTFYLAFSYLVFVRAVTFPQKTINDEYF